MVLPLLLACLFCPLAGLVLDSNTIRGSAEVQSARKGSPCQKDQDCSARQFCLSPDAGTPFCTTCRGLRRRCQGSAMCCPGIMCVNDVCAKAEEVTPVAGMQPDEQGGPITNARVTPSQTIREKRPKKKPDTTPPQSTKGQEGESCLRSLDCATGLCCARHFWSKICKPVLIEGQVCSGRKHKDIAQRPEIFQRCDCGPGLSCRPQNSAGKQKSRLRVCQRR